MTCLAMLASLFPCSISIDKHFANYEIVYQAIECLQNLLEYNSSRDAYLSFQNESNTSQ